MPELVRIAIVGPESTGKTTLSKKLAEHFKTSWVPEYARDYLETLDHPYTKTDVEYIAKRQLELEEQYAGQANNILICDTNLIVIKIWMEHAYNRCPSWIIEEVYKSRYHLHLLTSIDLPWEPDPLREHPHLRKHFYQLYLDELKKLKTPFAEISGKQDQRFQQAVTAIEKFLQL